MNLTIDNRNRKEIAQSLAAFLPGGDLWEAAGIEGSNLYALLYGLSGMYLEVENFNRLLMSDFIPISEGTAFLEDWERAVQIPDDCFPGPALDDRVTRRLHVIVKLASMGVQTADDFVRLAALLGFEFTSVMSGIDAGIPEPDGQFTIVVNFLFNGDGFPLPFPIKFGTSEFAFVECLFLKLIPANCTMEFGFKGCTYVGSMAGDAVAGCMIAGA